MELTVTQQERPWDRPFWKPVHGKEGVFAYLVLIHVLAVVGLILFPVPNLKVVGMTLLSIAFGGLGTTVCYHRMLAHKTLKTNPIIEHFLIFGFGWMGFFWMGAIRLVYSLHMQCLVNSLTHLNHVEEGDSSMNVWWLGPFQLTAWGENWHQNHHTHAGSARLGLRWYQTDIGWYFIWMLEAVGLAHSVKRPRTS